MQIEALRGLEVRARVLVAFRMKSTVEFDSNPLWVCGGISIHREFRLKKKIIATASISRASIVLSQSLSDIVNTVQGICLTRRPSRLNVVMGPNIWSADFKNKSIA
jgi:hypothetical protein